MVANSGHSSVAIPRLADFGLPRNPIAVFQTAGRTRSNEMPRACTTPMMMPLFNPSEYEAIEPFFGIGWVHSRYTTWGPM